METCHVTLRSSRRIALTTLAFGLILAGCGGSSPTPQSTVAATPPPTLAGPAATAATVATPAATGATAATPAATTAAVACPTADIVGTALGISLGKPSAVPGGGGTPLPAGATGLACDYRGAASNVLIELIMNVSPSIITQFSSRFPVPAAVVSGVGDQARSFTQPLGGGKDNEGVVATRGSTLVLIIATATPASLAQVEALVNQLL